MVRTIKSSRLLLSSLGQTTKYIKVMPWIRNTLPDGVRIRNTKVLVFCELWREREIYSLIDLLQNILQ